MAASAAVPRFDGSVKPRHSWLHRQRRQRLCFVCAATSRPRPGGDDSGSSNSSKTPPPPNGLPDLFGKAFGEMLAQAPPLPPLPPAAEEAVRAVSEALQDQIASVLDSYAQNEYEGYGAEDGSSIFGGPANAAKSRALATLARDRREVLQEERQRQGRQGKAMASPSPPPLAPQDQQRRAAVAAMRAARQEAEEELLAVAVWDDATADEFRREAARPAAGSGVEVDDGIPMAVHRYVPPPKPKASEAPLGVLGGLGVLSDEFVSLPPQRESGLDDELLVEQGALDGEDAAVSGSDSGSVPEDVDAILSSALSELDLVALGSGDRLITVSGEQMAARVHEWQRTAGTGQPQQAPGDSENSGKLETL